MPVVDTVDVTVDDSVAVLVLVTVEVAVVEKVDTEQSMKVPLLCASTAEFNREDSTVHSAVVPL